MIGVGSGHRPFLDYLLYNVQKSGYRDVVLLIGEKDESIKEYYKGKEQKAAFSEISLTYVVQPIPSGRAKPLGTADAVLCVLEARLDWNKKQFTVCNSDNLYTPEALKLLLNSQERNSMIDYEFEALRFPAERIFQFAILKTDSNGFLEDILEKPSEEDLGKIKGRSGISMNVFRFSYEDILPYLKIVPLHPVRNEKELPEAVRMMAAEHSRSMKTYRRAEYVPDLTTVRDIPEVQKYVAQHFSGITF
jgi:NDP-sugar pyrophosphorylase family protein